ncbi:EAL domain-containing protein [Aquipuribacter sp. MA13-6]|uniref:EAL domain-containing protein n=1 Tax=unclassified Aquipuribacter TaxID=2635084 RepID=UPI003EEF06D3
MTRPGDEQDSPELAFTAADAAALAARDSVVVARAATETVQAAEDAHEASRLVSDAARLATSDVVAAAASAAAETAAVVALEVQGHADRRARDVARSAVTALQVVSDLHGGPVGAPEARAIAARVAALVSGDVTTQQRLTDEAAEKVAEAVRLAAEAAALAAFTAATLVDEASSGAEGSARQAADASVATEAASAVAVGSAGRVAELAQRRVAMLRQAPLVAELRRALAEDELRLHYQAMLSVATGEVVGVEALLRWQHPTRGMLEPAVFLEAAEGPYLVGPVGDWVARAACERAARWQHEHGPRAPRVWINVSCDQLGRDHLVGVVGDVLAGTGLRPELLGLEVTERQLARRVDDVAADLLTLRGMGVALAVDDFGTGYASLDYLRRFTFDELKIDRCFVSGLQEATDRAVASSIVALGRSLGLTVVAEGVETAEQLELVTGLGVDVTQGFFHHRPAPADVVDEVLRRGTGS